MVSLSSVLANITESLDLSERSYETKFGEVKVTRVVGLNIFRVSVPSLEVEIETNPEEVGDKVEVTFRYFGTSPGSNLGIEELLEAFKETLR